MKILFPNAAWCCHGQRAGREAEGSIHALVQLPVKPWFEAQVPQAVKGRHFFSAEPDVKAVLQKAWIPARILTPLSPGVCWISFLQG